jgi:hypothetical protein
MPVSYVDKYNITFQRQQTACATVILDDHNEPGTQMHR